MSNSTDKELKEMLWLIASNAILQKSTGIIDETLAYINENYVSKTEANNAVVAELKSIHAKSDAKGTLYNETDRLIDERISTLTKKGQNSGKDN